VGCDFGISEVELMSGCDKNTSCHRFANQQGHISRDATKEQRSDSTIESIKNEKGKELWVCIMFFLIFKLRLLTFLYHRHQSWRVGEE